jgi:cytochrome c biogenesis protein CcmG, thiol:disulfide interchange protein DsbE
MNTRKWWLCACVAGGALLATASALAGAGVTVGSPAPPLIVTQLDGHEFDLARERGKVVVVNYWASWCSPCRAEMPALDKFYRRYQGQGLVLLGLSVDDAHDRAAVADIMRKFSYPAALAAGAKANGFGPALAVPMTFVIDATGVVRARLVSGTAVTEQSLEQLVVPLLPAAAAATR